MVNPSIKKFLKPSETRHKYGGDVNVALAHDISKGEYKIVHMFHKNHDIIGCMVFTLGPKSWRFVGNSPFETVVTRLAVVVDEHIVVNLQRDQQLHGKKSAQWGESSTRQVN